jgi:hypothetical protein
VLETGQGDKDEEFFNPNSPNKEVVETTVRMRVSCAAIGGPVLKSACGCGRGYLLPGAWGCALRSSGPGR